MESLSKLVRKVQRKNQLASLAAATALAFAACGGAGVEPEALQPSTSVQSGRPSTTAQGPKGTQSTSGQAVFDTTDGLVDVEQDLEYLAEILEPLVQLDQETAALIETDAWAMAEAFSISPEKARLRLLFERVFIQLGQAIRDDASVSGHLADTAISPPEDRILGHIHFVGRVPEEARRIVASSGIGGLVALHGNAEYTIEEIDLLTRDIAEATLDLGFPNSTWYDSGIEAFVVSLRIDRDTPEFTDEEILVHLAENIRDPEASGSILIHRVGSK